MWDTEIDLEKKDKQFSKIDAVIEIEKGISDVWRQTIIDNEKEV